MQEGPYHVPVMLQEVIAGLQIQSGGTYVDCTFGGGGHSKAILSQLDENGRMFVFDQDEDARKNVPPDDDRVTFMPYNFRHMQRFLRLHKVTKVNGILADLGVSSYQFDKAERGFSTRFDGIMDMRMDRRQTLVASDIINKYSEQKLHKMFEQNGGITNAKTLASIILDARRTLLLNSIDDFKNAIYTAVKGNPNKYFAQVFQALRIEVNDEAGALKEMMKQVPGLLLQGGRIAIITFHSLEDRVVKNFFKNGSFEERETDEIYGTKPKNELEIITKKPIVPSADEIKNNSRARSAKLRIAEKNE